MEKPLDDFDLRIIRAVQADARLTHQALSEHVGLSASQCQRRLKTLEQAGVIRGYTARIDEAALGYDIHAWVMVTLRKDNPGARATVVRFLKTCAWVVQATGVTGQIDFMLKVRARTMADFTRILVEELNRHPDIASTQSFAVLDEITG